MILKKSESYLFTGAIAMLGVILGIISPTYNASAITPVALVNISNKDSIPPDDNFANDDDRFIQQDFSQALFAQVYQIHRDCGFYTFLSPCAVRIYAFKDASLIAQRNPTGSVKFTLTFYQPISQEQALAYVNILNNGRDFDLTMSEVQPDMIIYRDCPYDVGGQKPALACEARLYLNSNRSISIITLAFIST